MALDPNIILQAGNFKVPDIAETMQLRELIKRKQVTQGREDAEYDRQQQLLGLRRQVGESIADGDLEGARQQSLESGDFDLYGHVKGIDDEKRAALRAKVAAAAPVVLRLKQYPYEKRKAAIMAAAPSLIANGWTPEEIEAFDPTDENSDALIGSTQLIENELKRYDEANKPQKLGYGDRLVDGKGNLIAEGNDAFHAVNTPKGGSTTIFGAPGGGTSSGGGSRGERNNNPGNLEYGKFAKSMGATGTDGRFAIFPTAQAGIKAQEALLAGKGYLGGGRNTIGAIISKYSPDGNERNYIGYVAKRLGIDPNAPLTAAQVPQVAAAMREFETGARPRGPITIEGKPDEDGWRQLTPQEAQQRGLDPNKNYQVGMGGASKGKIEALAGSDGDVRQKPNASIFQQYSDNNKTLRQIDKAFSALKKYPSAFGGGNILPDFIVQRTDPDGVEARALVSDIGGLIIHDRSGAAVTVGEMERLKPYIPNVTDKPSVVEKKLNQLKSAISEVQDDYDSYYRGLPKMKPAVAVGGGGPVRIKGDADYAKLPKGAMFIGPDGVTRRKP